MLLGGPVRLPACGSSDTLSVPTMVRSTTRRCRPRRRGRRHSSGTSSFRRPTQASSLGTSTDGAGCAPRNRNRRAGPARHLHHDGQLGSMTGRLEPSPRGNADGSHQMASGVGCHHAFVHDGNSAVWGLVSLFRSPSRSSRQWRELGGLWPVRPLPAQGLQPEYPDFCETNTDCPAGIQCVTSASARRYWCFPRWRTQWPPQRPMPVRSPRAIAMDATPA